MTRPNWILALSLGPIVTTSLFMAGCEVNAPGPPGPPAVVVGPPVVDVGPTVDIVDAHGYHHRGYYDSHHAWHGGYEDAHHVHHDDAHDWHR